MKKYSVVFILDYHKGELNVVFAYSKILAKLNINVKFIRLVFNQNYLNPHSSLLTDALKENYMGFGDRVVDVDISNLDEYLRGLQPVKVSMQLSIGDTVAEILNRWNYECIWHTHAFSSWPWYKQYLKYTKPGYIRSDTRLILHDEYSRKRFIWKGYQNIEVIRWPFLYQDLRLKNNSVLYTRNSIILYSYISRDDFFPVFMWERIHDAIMSYGKMYNMNLFVRSHPAQFINWEERYGKDNGIVDITDEDIYNVSESDGIHIGILTSGPLMAHIKGKRSLSIYPVNSDVFIDEHGIVPNVPMDTFSHLDMKCIEFGENCTKKNIWRLIDELRISKVNEDRSGPHMDKLIEDDVKRIYLK